MPKSHRQWAQEFVDLVQSQLKERLVSAVVYGSIARGTETPNSDIDLLLVIKGLPQGRLIRRQVLDPVHQEWNQFFAKEPPPFVATVLKTPEEAGTLSPIYFDMIDYRLLLVDRDGFFEKILDGVKKRLDRLGAKRKKLGKVEYWDLKPDYVPGEIFEI